jgi:hypothetical protein
MKSLPLTVLAWDGPQARAYLSRMRLAGLKPDRILLPVLNRHPVTRKPIGKWLPGRLRLRFLEKNLELANNYWPRRLRLSHPVLAGAMINEVKRLCEPVETVIDEMTGRFRYECYGNGVERVLVSGLSDPALSDALLRMKSGTVLFTGGGILRSNLLKLPGFQFLHVHPGYLPYVRGADGLLWSFLVRGRLGMSAFYMSSEIDTGDLIVAEEYSPVFFDLSGKSRPDDEYLYRAIFSFFDPVLRAEFLVSRVLTGGRDLSCSPSVAQDLSKGVTYHFMNPRLREKALVLMFRTGKRASENRRENRRPEVPDKAGRA